MAKKYLLCKPIKKHHKSIYIKKSSFNGKFFYTTFELILFNIIIMIQRIQSIWLLLASVFTFSSLKFSFYSGIKPNDTALHELNATVTFFLLITSIALGVLALMNIFIYKKRKTQLRLCVLGISLETLLIFLYYRETATFTQGTYSLTAILQSLVILAFGLAVRAINKDEKMVKDSDRLR